MLFDKLRKNDKKADPHDSDIESAEIAAMNLPKAFEADPKALSKASRSVYRRGAESDLLDDMPHKSRKVKTGTWL